MDLNNKPILHNWIEFGSRIVGTVYNDSRRNNGAMLMTSNVKSIDRENGNLETMNTSYDLGKEIE